MHTYLSTLKWFSDMGIDELLEEETINQQQKYQQAKKIKTSPTSANNNVSEPKIIPQIQPITKPLIASPSELVLKTTKLADACNNLTDLKEAVTNFKDLAICKTATNTVFSDGSATAKVMFVGEAPGADEDIQGIPFCGASGQLLEQIVSCIGLSRKENFYITNTLFWRPPGNRKPTPEEIAICRPFVQKHIALIDPDLIILVGATAIASLLENEANSGITKMRGKWYDYTNKYLKNPIPVTPIFHPSYLLRSPGQKKFVWEDLLMIEEKWKDNKSN